MRRLRYNVAISLDGFIAGSRGEFDWIAHDDAIDFAGLFAEFDLFVMGRKTYETIRAQGDQDPTLGQKVIVASRTLEVPDRADVQIVRTDIAQTINAAKQQQGKDIWLFGGGELVRTLFDAKLVDTVEVAVMPVLIGEGIPLLPPGECVKLALRSARAMPSGIQMLAYDVRY